MLAIDPITVYSFLAILALLVLAYIASLIFLPRTAPRADKLAFCWYAFDALTHFILEGSFVYLSSFGSSVASSEGAFASLWKEYGKADARWLHSDPTVVSLEILTVVFCGPLCVYLLYALAARSPARHYWQLVLCTAEIYGVWLTFYPEHREPSLSLGVPRVLQRPLGRHPARPHDSVFLRPRRRSSAS
ncbi:Emopamil binding protein-domain-containing protein [Jimgerdemannia flammicorona]|uniref:Emopamil binding protein-domain-containing protein n=1 Tax=Jimgerdemannia flammicorona TaxID=994334 RepID=A0A433PJG5_9FUNG|nr:Emopamil binding protein-domain-containing protein [Jimgerdemannia flammicorona]